MKVTNIIGMLVVLALGISQTSFAQTTPETGSVGLRASIGGQGSIEVPYMFTETLSIAPYIGLSATQDATTNFSVGLSPRYYLSGTEDLTPYATGRLGFQNTSFNNANSSVFDVNLGVGFGAEYFFNPSFSISGDANLNARFGDSATNIGTGARVAVSFYF